MGYDISDTYQHIAVEVTTAIEHLSKSATPKQVTVDSSTKAALKELGVPMQGEGNTIELAISEALKALTEQFHKESNRKKTGGDYRSEVERSIADLLNASIDTPFISVITHRCGDLLIDDVARSVGDQPFKKKRRIGGVNTPLSTTGRKKRYGIYIAFTEAFDKYDSPDAILKNRQHQSAWEFLSGKSVQALRLLTLQVGD